MYGRRGRLYGNYMGNYGDIAPLKTLRSKVRGGDRHPRHLDKHCGYARLGFRGMIRMRKRFYVDFLADFRHIREKIKNILGKIDRK